MKVQKSFFTLLFVGAICFTSCNEEETPAALNCSNWSTEYSSILLDLVAAAADWEEEESVANCQNLVDSYTAAINSMEDFLDEDCIPEESKAGIESAISTWNSLKSSLDCSSAGS